MRQGRNRCFADPLFLPCQKKWAKRGAWRRSGLYRSATEVPRRRTWRPAHDKLFTKLRYSAACVETTLPSETVATQGDGKTHCHGNGRPSAYAPVVQNRNRPSIPEMSGTEIIAGFPQMRVVHLSGTISYRENNDFAPVRSFRPRSGQKFARISAQYNASPAHLFAYFFWQDRWNQIANQRSVCNLERTSNGTDETCRLRRGEGLREAPRAQALRRAIGLAERMQSEASLGVCEDEPPEARLQRRC